MEIKKLNWDFSNYSFYLVDEIPSTNTYLKENYSKYPDKTCLIATKQTCGRGRYNRVWVSEDDCIFSILLKKNGSYHITVPLALSLALQSLGYDTYQESFSSAIIGIGLNMSDKKEFNAIGLNTKLSKYEIISEVLLKLDELNQMDFDSVIELYRKKSIVVGRMVYYHEKLYKAIGVDSKGYLILENDNEILHISGDEINIKESLR